MNLFGDSKQEKEFGHFVHELNSSTTEINFRLGLISEWLRENAKLFNENGINAQTVYIAVEYIKSNNERIQDSQDRYYNEFKNDFAEK